MKADIHANCLLRATTICSIMFGLIVVPQAAWSDIYTTVAAQFFPVVEAHLNQWARRHDGIVTAEDIDVALQDPSIKGDEAAALTALKLGERSLALQGKPTIRYTHSLLDDLQRQVQQGARLQPDYIHYFDWGRRKLASQSRLLFAQGIPHLAAIRQDKTSDCYLLSAIGALANANPQAIVNMIRQNADGSFQVQLPGQKLQRVTAPTDAEIAAYSDAGKDGIWLNVLEKACAQTNFTHRQAIEPMDVVACGGGFSGEAIELITGHVVIATRFHSPESSAKSDLQNQVGNFVLTLQSRFHQIPSTSDRKNHVRGILSLAFKNHKLVTTGKMDHLYAVTGYDPAHDTVTLWNPQGRSGLEKFPDGRSVPKMENGIFSISVDDFVNNFVGMVVEQ